MDLEGHFKKVKKIYIPHYKGVWFNVRPSVVVIDAEKLGAFIRHMTNRDNDV